MLPVRERSAFRVAALLAAISFGLLAFGSEAWMIAHAAGEASPKPAAEPTPAEAKPAAEPASAEAKPKGR